MVNKNSYLTVGQCLNVGDYLLSDNNAYFAIMQSNGQLAVYRGTGPADNHGNIWASPGGIKGSDAFFAIMQSNGQLAVYRGTGPADNHGNVWASPISTTLPSRKSFVIIEDDGNFTVYAGSDPADNHGLLWCTGFSDPVVEIIEVSDIQYDLQHVKVLSSGLAPLDHLTYPNISDITVHQAIKKSESVTETSGWSDSLGMKIGASTTVKVSIGIPRISAEGSITMSAEVNNTYTWNGSTSVTKSMEIDTSIDVPPFRTMVVFISTSVSIISVPYKLTGIGLLKSGSKTSVVAYGVYTGTDSKDITITTSSLNPINHETETNVQEISQMH
jgi:hypothetical protein